MPVTLNTAKDAIRARFWEDWSTLTAAIAGSTPAVEWDNVEATGSPATVDAPWCRHFIRHQPGRQATMGSTGNRRFERMGTITIQIFVPQRIGDGMADDLAQVAVNAYEGQHAQVDTGECCWFHNVGSHEVGAADGWYQVNVTAEFIYDHTK